MPCTQEAKWICVIFEASLSYKRKKKKIPSSNHLLIS